MGMVIVEGAVFWGWVDLGCPIVTNGEFVACNCVEVREPIELSFGVVSGVGREMGVLHGVHVTQGEGRFLEF